MFHCPACGLEVLPLKARRNLPGYPPGSMGGSTAFPAGGADGLVRERNCSDATPRRRGAQRKGLTDGWLHERRRAGG